ncbi:MAG: hypothetical protein K8S99_09415 [Planctomycetes bacterium]|nr:hypothetical protein [Planctomycetota bacterium]
MTTIRGYIMNGVVVLDESVNLPDGTPILIEVERVDASFWRDKSAVELAREQNVHPCVDPADLAGDWPADESVDDFLAMIKRSRV